MKLRMHKPEPVQDDPETLWPQPGQVVWCPSDEHNGERLLEGRVVAVHGNNRGVCIRERDNMVMVYPRWRLWRPGAPAR